MLSKNNPTSLDTSKNVRHYGCRRGYTGSGWKFFCLLVSKPSEGGCIRQMSMNYYILVSLNGRWRKLHFSNCPIFMGDVKIRNERSNLGHHYKNFPFKRTLLISVCEHENLTIFPCSVDNISSISWNLMIVCLIRWKSDFSQYIDPATGGWFLYRGGLSWFFTNRLFTISTCKAK